MSETTPEVPVEEPTPEPDSPMPPNLGEYYDDANLTYYWRNEDTGEVFSRPYGENEIANIEKRVKLDGLRAEADEAIPYLSERIDLSLAFLANQAPTPEETAAQIKVLRDLAAYSAGTLKRMILVLGELTGRPVM
ncbi:hypothetical protein [Streptomyces phage phiScoe1]|nr:hypothetical protein [Streptomyces phage phiScoe1]